METKNEKELRKQRKLELSGIVASAVLGATLTYCTLTARHEREMNELRHHAVYERARLYINAELYINEWRNHAYRNEQIDRKELAKQYGIPLNEREEIDYQALQNAMFPLGK